MKLSEAIRLGAMATAPIHGPIFNGKQICATCAIGAPLYAVYGNKAYDISQNCAFVVMEVIAARWPWVRTYGPLSLTAEMIRRFESQKQTREEIADWIATIEPVEQSSDVDASSLPDAVACPVGTLAV